MGAFADDVSDHLRDRLSALRPELSWETEYRVGVTPVDVAGLDGDRLVAVELEWRRADPAANTVKLFRHLSSGTLDAERVLVFQVFTRYYDLASGGVNSKRKDAEFVGRVAADAVEPLSFAALTFDLDPPAGDRDRPEEWREAADDVAETIADRL